MFGVVLHQLPRKCKKVSMLGLFTGLIPLLTPNQQCQNGSYNIKI